jgi:hypothetical protein
VKQHEPALSRLSGLVKKKEEKKKKRRKVFFSLLTSLFSCIFSLIAIAILNTFSKRQIFSFLAKNSTTESNWEGVSN